MASAVTLRELAKQVSDSISAESLDASTFAIGGKIPIAQPQGVSSPASQVEMDQKTEKNKFSSATVVLCSYDDAKAFDHLLKVSEKATFGFQGRHKFDDTYRKAQKLGAGDFCTTFFCPHETGIIAAVSQVLLPSYDFGNDKRSIRAELYNMNIYSGPSGKFKAHVDTPRSSYQIGSLAVCLPMMHQGGELAVRHLENTHTFDWATNSDESLIQWAAFYSDCEHEVFEVKSGHRITLTYNLYATAGNGDLGGQSYAFSPTSLPLYNKILAMLTSDKFKSKDRLLGLYSTHAYPNTEQEHVLPFCLKGLDMVLYNTFKSLGLEVHLCAILENPIGYERRGLEDGKFSDEDTDANSMEKKKELAEELDPGGDSSSGDYNPSRVVGVLNKVYAADSMVRYVSEVQGIIKWAVETQKIKFDASKIVWLNQSNAGKKVQASYIAICFTVYLQIWVDLTYSCSTATSHPPGRYIRILR
ncbi:hypothetical protein BDP55DRAFT_752394 [Colletotrichum godetiae]|uniref:Prolyl 4-hydroxylase alpha subunit Fe(2+) 2OG dioxygenase domain-containing protein n=1 Tax=Colletotrichum godetiae TaxID=1209918 RepID=A0AAJ0EPK0_9PEZI|nr:uncharacterized protein BDP55DRAFT_752394 [Colletotrichum godetiae]KAK1671766.1 hypothetical protein BDP55DRAFT_752394 [Colletotrichum godetiae]